MHFDPETGTPNGSFALYGKGLSGLPNAEGLGTTCTNDLFEFYLKFRRVTGGTDVPCCSTSAPPLPSSAEREPWGKLPGYKAVQGALGCVGGATMNVQHGGRVAKGAKGKAHRSRLAQNKRQRVGLGTSTRARPLLDMSQAT